MKSFFNKNASSGKVYCRFLIGIVLLMICQFSYAQEIDILLKGAHLIDPKNKIDSKMDVGILNGRIARIANDIPIGSATKIIDVTGFYITPGIIDMHVHVFQGTDKYSTSVGNSSRSQQADAFSFRTSVTTVVDADLLAGEISHCLKNKPLINRKQEFWLSST